MKTCLAIIAALCFASAPAFAQGSRPQPQQAPPKQVPLKLAQARGGESAGAGQATGGSSIVHTLGQVAVVAAWAAVAASALRPRTTTNH